jgi:hypothetical protein
LRFLLAIWLLTAPAFAQVGQVAVAPYAPPVNYTGPLDAVGGGTPVLYLGIRGSTSSYSTGSNQTIQAQRASDGETCNFNIAVGGNLGLTTGCSGSDNGKTAATWLSGTTGTATSGTDQTGTSTPFTGSVGLLPGCDGSIVCFTFNGSQQLFNGSANLSQAQPYTFAIVFYMPSGISAPGTALSTFPVSVGTQNAASCTPSSANCATAYAGFDQQSIPATSNAWHSLIVVFNGASSTYSVDGATPTTVSGNLGTNTLTSSGSIGAFAYAQFYYGDLTEAMIFASALSGTQQTNLCHNMRIYFSTGGTC